MNMSTGGQPPFDPNRQVESKEDVGSPKRIIISLLVVLGLGLASIVVWLARGS